MMTVGTHAEKAYEKFPQLLHTVVQFDGMGFGMGMGEGGSLETR